MDRNPGTWMAPATRCCGEEVCVPGALREHSLPTGSEFLAGPGPLSLQTVRSCLRDTVNATSEAGTMSEEKWVSRTIGFRRGCSQASQDGLPAPCPPLQTLMLQITVGIYSTCAVTDDLFSKLRGEMNISGYLFSTCRLRLLPVAFRKGPFRIT